MLLCASGAKTSFPLACLCRFENHPVFATHKFACRKHDCAVSCNHWRRAGELDLELVAINRSDLCLDVSNIGLAIFELAAQTAINSGSDGRFALGFPGDSVIARCDVRK